MSAIGAPSRLRLGVAAFDAAGGARERSLLPFDALHRALANIGGEFLTKTLGYPSSGSQASRRGPEGARLLAHEFGRREGAWKGFACD